MAGGIVNVGPFDDLPGIAGLKERLLLIQISAFRADGHLLPLEDLTAAPTPYYVNGQVNPTIRLCPGETQRWRIGNISADFFVNLHLDGHTLHETMADANPRDRPLPQNAIGAGTGGADRGAGAGGGAGHVPAHVAALRRGPAGDAGGGAGDDSGRGGAGRTSTPLPTELVPFLDLRTVPVDRTRELEFQMVPQPDGTFKDQISGRQFDPDVVNQVVRLGATEEWTISNATEFGAGSTSTSTSSRWSRSTASPTRPTATRTPSPCRPTARSRCGSGSPTSPGASSITATFSTTRTVA